MHVCWSSTQNADSLSAHQMCGAGFETAFLNASGRVATDFAVILGGKGRVLNNDSGLVNRSLSVSSWFSLGWWGVFSSATVPQGSRIQAQPNEATIKTFRQTVHRKCAATGAYGTELVSATADLRKS